MSSLVIKEGKNTPTIDFNINTRKFLVYGRSFPENAKKFYQPVLEWLKNISINEGKIDLEFKLFYISSSSIISILEIIKRFDELNKIGVSVSVIWNYESDDEDLLKIGEDYKKVCNIDFLLMPNE